MVQAPNKNHMIGAVMLITGISVISSTRNNLGR